VSECDHNFPVNSTSNRRRCRLCGATYAESLLQATVKRQAAEIERLKAGTGEDQELLDDANILLTESKDCIEQYQKLVADLLRQLAEAQGEVERLQRGCEINEREIHVQAEARKAAEARERQLRQALEWARNMIQSLDGSIDTRPIDAALSTPPTPCQCAELRDALEAARAVKAYMVMPKSWWDGDWSDEKEAEYDAAEKRMKAADAALTRKEADNG
jgi:hypothetical protein